MALILTQAQAEAVYSAMCALDVAGVKRFSAVIPGKDADGSSNYIEVVRAAHGAIVIEKRASITDLREAYNNLYNFAIAYGFNV